MVLFNVAALSPSTGRTIFRWTVLNVSDEAMTIGSFFSMRSQGLAGVAGSLLLVGILICAIARDQSRGCLSKMASSLSQPSDPHGSCQK